MKKLIILTSLLCCITAAFAQKPDLTRSPNGPNTIVDWNVKFKSLIAPHGNSLSLNGAQDSAGHIKVLLTDSSFNYYVGNGVWLKVKPSANTNINALTPLNKDNAGNLTIRRGTGQQSGFLAPEDWNLFYKKADSVNVYNALNSKATNVQDTSALKNTIGLVGLANYQVVNITERNTAGTFVWFNNLPSGITADGIRAFVANGGGYWVRSYTGPIHTSWAGIRSTLPDATGLLQKLLNIGEEVYFDSGVTISSVTVKSNLYVNHKPINQLAGIVGLSVFNVSDGSNIIIDGVEESGLINSATGEQNHGIKVQAFTASPTSVTIRNSTFANNRGDGIYVGGGFAPKTPFPTQIYIYNVKCPNSYRNALSVTSGREITIDRFYGYGGLKGIDLETNSNDMYNVWLSNITTSNISMSGVKGNPAKNIAWKNITIDYNLRLLNTVIYPGSANDLKYGVVFRNAEFVTIENIKIRNTPLYAFGTVYGGPSTDDFCKNIRIINPDVDSCAVGSGALGNFFLGSVVNLAIQGGSSKLPDGETTKAHIYAGSTSNQIQIDGTRFINGKAAVSANLYANKISVINGANGTFSLLPGSIIENSAIYSLGTLLSFSTDITFRSDSLKYTIRNTSGYDRNTFVNCIENGSIRSIDWGTAAPTFKGTPGSTRFNTNPATTGTIISWVALADSTFQPNYRGQDYYNTIGTWTKPQNYVAAVNSSSGSASIINTTGSSLIAQADGDNMYLVKAIGTFNGNGKANTQFGSFLGNGGAWINTSGSTTFGDGLIVGPRPTVMYGMSTHRGPFDMWDGSAGTNHMVFDFDATSHQPTIRPLANGSLGTGNLLGTWLATTQATTDSTDKIATDKFVKNLIATNTVTKFNGRTGAITPLASDYSFAYVQPANTFSGAGTGVNFTATATQTANNQAFYGVTFNTPTVTTNSFTGALIYALRSVGPAILNSSLTVGGGASISGTTNAQTINIGYNGSAATSAATQRNGFAFSQSVGLFDGTSALTRYSVIQSLASNTNNNSYRLAFGLNSTSGSGLVSAIEPFTLFNSNAIGLLGATTDPGANNIAIGATLPTTTNLGTVLAVDGGLVKTLNLTNTNADNFVTVGVNTTLTYDPNISAYLLTGSKMVVNLAAASNYYSGGNAKRLMFVNNSTEYNTISTSGTDLFNSAGNSGPTLIIPARSTLIISAINSSTFAPLQMTGFSYGIASNTNITLTFGQEYQATNNSGQTFTLPPITSNAVGKNYSITINNISSGTVTVNSNAGGNDIRVSTSLVSSDTIVSGAVVTYTPYWDGSVLYFKRQ